MNRVPLRIVVADDDPDQLALLEATARQAGLDVVGTAADGLAALEAVHRLSPDVLVSDLTMPGLDGDSVAMSLRETCPVAVVIVSGHGQDDMVDRASQAGVGAYLVKPFNAGELKRAVEISLARFREMAAARRDNAELQDLVKELRCLYGLSELLSSTETDRATVIGRTLDLLRQAWRDPCQTCLRLELGTERYETECFALSPQRMGAPILVLGEPAGELQVCSRSSAEERLRGFLEEERQLLQTAARMLSRYLERCEVEGRFRATFEQAAVGVAHISPDRRFLRVNEKLCHMLGYSANQLKELTASDITHPDDLEPSRLALAELLERRRSWGALEKRYLRKDSSLLWVLVTASVVWNQDGTPSYLILAVEDISRRKTIQSLLNETEHMASLGSWEQDLSSSRFTVSPELLRILGLPPDSTLTHKRFLELVHPDDRRALERRGAHLRSGESLPPADFRLLRPDGSVRHVTARVQSESRDGEVVRVWGSVQDVTERRRLEQELLQSQKMEAVGRLAGGVAHDFNNQLTTVLGFGELLREALPDSGRREMLEEMLSATRRAERLTRQLLTFSRQDVPHPTRLDAASTVAQSRELLRHLLGEDVCLTISVPPEPVWIHFDRVRLEQVLSNLAINSRHAMPGGGKLTVSVRRIGHEAEISVADTGCGMDEATRSRAFEPFFTTRSTAEGGTGLGLSTVYAIVERHSGQARLDSTPGVGTTVSITLPLHLEQGPAAPPQAERSSPSRTVLVVEDEEPLRRLVTRVLEREGYRVLAASCAAEALELAANRSDEVDLVLTDVVMPGMSGTELVDRLAPQRALFMSGYARESVDRLVRDQAQFLSKPFTPRELTSRVRALFE